MCTLESFIKQTKKVHLYLKCAILTVFNTVIPIVLLFYFLHCLLICWLFSWYYVTDNSSVRSNALFVLGDMCVRYTNLVDRHIGVLAACLQVRTVCVLYCTALCTCYTVLHCVRAVLYCTVYVLYCTVQHSSWAVSKMSTAPPPPPSFPSLYLYLSLIPLLSFIPLSRPPPVPPSPTGH